MKQQSYKGYLITTKEKVINGKVKYKCVVHTKWRKIDETRWWADEETAEFDAMGMIEQRLRDKEK